MSVETITNLILEYRYWILIPLSLVEGPVVAFVAGTLAAFGQFNVWVLAVIFFLRDIGLDGVYYAIGYFGGHTKLAHKMLDKIGITADHLENVRALWAKRPGMTMLVGKLSYGIASAFIVVAGIVRMPLTSFFGYGSLVAILQYWTLVFLGFFLGASVTGIGEIISNIQYVIAIAAIAISAYYLISWRMRKKFLAKDKEIEAQPAEGETPQI